MKSGFFKLAMKEKNPIKPLFNSFYAIFCPKIAIIINPIFPMMFVGNLEIRTSNIRKKPEKTGPKIPADPSYGVFLNIAWISFKQK